MLPAANTRAPLGALYSVVSARSKGPRYDWTNPLARVPIPAGSAPLANRRSLSFWYTPAMTVSVVAPVPLQIQLAGSLTCIGAAAHSQSPYISPMNSFSGRAIDASRHKQVAKDRSTRDIGSWSQNCL